MVCKGKSVLGDEWSIQPITSDICIAMETKAVECVQCAPTQTEVRRITSLHFTTYTVHVHLGLGP